MQTYKIIGHSAILGVGLTLNLSKSQASTRIKSLKQKKKDIYIVLEPVQFKQGEIISVISGNVSKSVLVNLEDTSKQIVKQDQKTSKAPAKTKGKKSVTTPTTTPKDDGDGEDNSSNENPDEDENSQPKTGDEAIVTNVDVNNLPKVTK